MSNINIDIQEIFKLIPHRYPFLLVDKVIEFTAFDTLKAIKNVTINEPFFTGHFPCHPIMPGVLILEALAQAGAMLWSLSQPPSEGYRHMYFFAGIDNAKFKHMVVPGDQLIITAKMTSQKRGFCRVHGEA